MTEHPSDYWVVGEAVDVVLTHEQDWTAQGGKVWPRGSVAFPNEQRATVSKIARKYVYVTLPWGTEEAYSRATGRSQSQHGFFSLVKPGEMPLVIAEDSQGQFCCACNERHK